MNQHPYEVAVVGGGIVGLATALAFVNRFPHARLIVLEKESQVAVHQTTHNSGVIHTGLYYRPGSHKAQLCVEGSRRLLRFCAERGIRVEVCGKVIVARDEHERARLGELLQQGLANGVNDLELIGPKRLREIEPHAAGVAAIYSPSTAIVDFREVAKAIAEDLQMRGVEIAFDAGVVGVSQADGGLIIRTRRGDLRARHLVNCAGLYADRIARLSGDRPSVRIIPFRGSTTSSALRGVTWCAH